MIWLIHIKYSFVVNVRKLRVLAISCIHSVTMGHHFFFYCSMLCWSIKTTLTSPLCRLYGSIMSGYFPFCSQRARVIIPPAATRTHSRHLNINTSRYWDLTDAVVHLWRTLFSLRVNIKYKEQSWHMGEKIKITATESLPLSWYQYCKLVSWRMHVTISDAWQQCLQDLLHYSESPTSVRALPLSI